MTGRLKKCARLPILPTVVISRRGIVSVAQTVTLLGALALAAASSRAEHWNAPTLLVMLIGFGILSEILTVEGRGLRISGSFIAIVLAMVTLGPAPAALVGLSGIAFDAARSRPSALNLLGNVTTYATFPLLGGFAYLAVEPALQGADELVRVGAVAAVFMGTNVLNFFLIAVPRCFVERDSVGERLRDILVPLLPSQLAAAVLTAAVDELYLRHGILALASAAVAALLFQHLLRTTVESVDRANELEKRTLELAGMQVGLVTTVLRTLSLRDKMTARHSAAVARYAREVAREMGLDEAVQETVHTAGLLHDIGKFTFPDSVLVSDRGLTDEEYAVVKLHPEQGARLVGRLQGYEEVAEIIHAHHERPDGRGYPRGLTAAEIPIGSRIIAVCDTYDVMTSRDSYRASVTPPVALAELRRVAGTQLDPEIVAVFTRLIECRGVAFRHSDDADFEAELSSEARVAEYASPRRMVA